MATQKLAYTSELMTNFKQASAVTAHKKFQALQLSDNYALLFSISTENIFYITRETPGAETGWQQFDLSSLVAGDHQNQPVQAKTFGVYQNTDNQKINIALVVTVNNKDHLYISLNNEITASLTEKVSIQWTPYPFDAPATSASRIEEVHIAQTKSEAYIVADLSDDASALKLLDRYYIDIKNKKDDRYWHSMTMGGDLEAGAHSVLGRKAKETVDGIYTIGKINQQTQLQYVPLYNRINPSLRPLITTLEVPETPDTLAVARVSNELTDLFVAANTSIYYFAADKQKSGTTGEIILQNKLFEGITQLYAFFIDGIYTLWGLNRANQIFHTSCKKEDLYTPSRWTNPVPLLKNIHHLAPFINRHDNSRTFFTASATGIRQTTQPTQTTLWQHKDVAVKAPLRSKAQQISSYTTRLELTDEDNKPLQDTEVYISASSRTGVTINYLYYVLTPEPIPVTTDNTGCITIIEEVNNLVGTPLTITTAEGLAVHINPMEKPFKKIAAIDTAEKVKNADIEYSDGGTKRLVDKDTSDDDLKSVANANKQMADAYKDVSQTKLLFGPRRTGLAVYNMPAAGNQVYLQGFGLSSFLDLGDLFSWIGSGIVDLANTTFNFIKDIANNAWNLVVSVGGAIYHGVMDCVEKIVAAVEWVYNKVKTAIEDLIKFLEFLFQWKDIERTKKAIYNITYRAMEHQVAQVAFYKKEVHTKMEDLIKIIEQWAGIAGDKMGDDGKAKVGKAPETAENHSAPGTMVTYHFQQQAGNGDTTQLLFASSINVELVKRMIEVLEKQVGLVGHVLTQFFELLLKAPGMQLEELLKKIAGIISGAFLRSAQIFLDLVFDLVSAMSDMLFAAFTTDIYIPIVTDILRFFGVGSFSMLDVMSWLVAIPGTLAYKIAFQHAPFPDNGTSQKIINAKSLTEIKDILSPPQTLLSNHLAVGSFSAKDFYTASHMIAGVAQILGGIALSLEAIDTTDSNLISGSSIALGIINASFLLTAALVVPRMPVVNQTVVIINGALGVAALTSKVYFSYAVRKKFEGLPDISKDDLDPKKLKRYGTAVDAVLAVASLGTSGYHFHEMKDKKFGREKTEAIMEETANLMSQLARISFSATYHGMTPCLPGISIFNGISGALHIAAAAIESESA